MLLVYSYFGIHIEIKYFSPVVNNRKGLAVACLSAESLYFLVVLG